MSQSNKVEVIRHKYELLRPLMNERMRRQWAACEAMSLSRGGFALVAEATGLSRTTSDLLFYRQLSESAAYAGSEALVSKQLRASDANFIAIDPSAM